MLLLPRHKVKDVSDELLVAIAFNIKINVVGISFKKVMEVGQIFFTLAAMVLFSHAQIQEQEQSVDKIDHTLAIDKFYGGDDYEDYRDLAVAYNFTIYTVS